MTQRNTLDPDPAGPPPADELDSLLRQWHAVNAEQAAAGRDRLLERLRAQERARKQRPTADRAVAGSLTAFFLLIRSALVNRYSPAAALMVFIVIFAVLFPSSQGPAMAQFMMVPEGGRLDAIDDEGNIIGPCPLKHTDVDVSISGFLTRVIVTQTYHNPYHDKIEAVYTFPLSHRGAVDPDQRERTWTGFLICRQRELHVQLRGGSAAVQDRRGDLHLHLHAPHGRRIGACPRHVVGQGRPFHALGSIRHTQVEPVDSSRLAGKDPGVAGHTQIRYAVAIHIGDGRRSVPQERTKRNDDGKSRNQLPAGLPGVDHTI